MNFTTPVMRDVVNRPAELRDAPAHLSIVELKLARLRLSVDCGTLRGTPGALLIGQCPGPNMPKDLPLFPSPETSSASRLMRMSDLTAEEFLTSFYRRNLCDRQVFSEPFAARRARELYTALFDSSRDLRVVILGRRAADAFDVDDSFWTPHKLESRQIAVVIPHPTGKNPVYQDPNARLTTRAWMRWAAFGGAMPTTPRKWILEVDDETE